MELSMDEQVIQAHLGQDEDDQKHEIAPKAPQEAGNASGISPDPVGLSGMRYWTKYLAKAHPGPLPMTNKCATV